MIKIVTDSGIDIPVDAPKEIADSITIVPLSFTIVGISHMDAGEDRLTTGEFLDLIEKSWPTTSAPSPESFAMVFREIVSKGDQVLCITISGGLSATKEAAVIAARDFPYDVRVIDSKSVSLGMYYLVEYAKELISKPLSLHRIAKKLESKTRKIKSFVLVKDLNNLLRGGRIGPTGYLIASLLSIKPLLQMNPDGKLREVSRGRTWKKAKEDMINKTLSLTDMPNVVKGGVIHVQNLEEATQVANSLRNATGIDFDIAETGPVIATHTGRGALGVVVVEIKR
ncbi:MAG TPA: DegV family protein [Patescibacteria group bacterium]|nr:DegV family protein [bacterium]HRY56864.1 DegV family protein [Patescibacteria group bacterium]